MRKEVLNLTLSALFVAFMAAAGTVLKIPLPPPFPPLSMQFFFSLLSGIILGSKLGALSMVTYIVLGLLGCPIFSTGGGVSYVFYPSFGYILGFIGSAFLVGFARERIDNKLGKVSFRWLLVGCFSAMTLVYFCGVSYMYVIRNLYMHSNLSALAALQVGALAFMPTDSIWCVLAALVGKKLLLLSKKEKYLYN